MHFGCYRELGVSLTVKCGGYKAKKNDDINTLRFRKEEWLAKAKSNDGARKKSNDKKKLSVKPLRQDVFHAVTGAKRFRQGVYYVATVAKLFLQRVHLAATVTRRLQQNGLGGYMGLLQLLHSGVPLIDGFTAAKQVPSFARN